MTNKTKQIFIKGLQLAVAILSLFYISYKLSTEKQHFQMIQTHIEATSVGIGVFFLIFILVFSFFNWSLEFVKWRRAVSHFQKLSFLKAAFQSFAGHSVGILTPQRLGDYAAKLIFFQKSDHQKVLLANFRASYAQLLSTVIFGLVSLVYFVKFFNFQINTLLLSSILFLIFGTLVFILFSKPKFKQKLSSIFLNQPRQFGALLSLSFLKQLIFSHQFYFLLSYFVTDINYLEAMMAINLMYLFASFLPSLFIVDFAIKGSVGIFIFNYLQVSAVGVGLVSFLMWFLNFALPAFIGTILMSQMSLQKSFSN